MSSPRQRLPRQFSVGMASVQSFSNLMDFVLLAIDDAIDKIFCRRNRAKGDAVSVSDMIWAAANGPSACLKTGEDPNDGCSNGRRPNGGRGRTDSIPVGSSGRARRIRA